MPSQAVGTRFLEIITKTACKVVLVRDGAGAARARQVWEATPGCGEAPFLDSVWTAIDEAVALQDCDVYSYKSDGETDPFGAGRFSVV